MATGQPNTSSPDVYAQIWALSKTVLKPDGNPNYTEIARQTGTSKDTVGRTLRKPELKLEYPAFVTVGDEDEPIEDIIARKRKGFERKAKAQSDREWFEIKVKETKPYGVLMFGDPHLDDDGCNIPLLERHLEIAAKPGVYSINIGDTANNWVGRLERLYASQETSKNTGKRLVEWFMFSSGATWLCWILGNHDEWNDGVDFHMRLAKHKIPVIDWRAQFKLVHPNGTEARIDASHGRKGSSIWNNLHATLRAAKLGEVADAYITGHTHNFGLEDVEIAERRFSTWLVQLRGYKFMDHFALVNNFAEHQRGSAVLAIIDPRKDARRPVMQCFEDVETGYRVLEMLRS
jgi:hypothetical protein